MTRNPYQVASSADRVFWADAAADAVEASDPDAPIVIKGGVSPSGVPHIGHVNELLRGYFVAEALRDRGHDVQQVFTADDRDALRAVPHTLADLDGNLVGLGDVNAAALGRNIGVPYTDVPDPFGCCESYGDHFSNLLAGHAEVLDIPVEFVSNTDTYENGGFEGVTRQILERVDLARGVVSDYQETVDDSYVPFVPQCENCGILTEGVTGVDLEAGTVSYVCEDRDADGETVEGCGHDGAVTLREGKLPWRFEWPAQWATFDVDFEPFGKDHAEGSWPSGEAISDRVLDIRPPVPMVYEWFTLEGDALSSSAGNVVTVDEALELLEPEVFRYFFAKEPLKQRDFSVASIDQLVDEFDRLERVYFGEVSADEREEAFAERVYPTLVDEPRAERVRIPYTFAAVLGMTGDPDLREEIARREGHVSDDAPEWAVEGALARVKHAREWARRTGNAFDYELKRDTLPEEDFDEHTERALDELAEFVAAGHDGEAIQEAIYETARRHDVPVGEFFAAGYRLFFDDQEGPKLGLFLAELDREFVVSRLRRER
jgi:lysyl-tRNA synthetase, archaeal and spirochete